MKRGQLLSFLALLNPEVWGILAIVFLVLVVGILGLASGTVSFLTFGLIRPDYVGGFTGGLLRVAIGVISVYAIYLLVKAIVPNITKKNFTPPVGTLVVVIVLGLLGINFALTGSLVPGMQAQQNTFLGIPYSATPPQCDQLSCVSPSNAVGSDAVAGAIIGAFLVGGLLYGFETLRRKYLKMIWHKVMR